MSIIWYKCKFCGRETRDNIEICRGCGAPMEHEYMIVDTPYFGNTYSGIVTCSGMSMTEMSCNYWFHRADTQWSYT